MDTVWRDLTIVGRNEASVLGFANFTLYCEEIQVAERNPKVFYAYMPRIKDMIYELVYTAWKANEYDAAIAAQPKPRRFWQFYKPKPKAVPIPDYQGPPITEVQRLMDIILDGLLSANVPSIMSIRPTLQKYSEIVQPCARKNLDEMV